MNLKSVAGNMEEQIFIDIGPLKKKTKAGNPEVPHAFAIQLLQVCLQTVNGVPNQSSQKSHFQCEHLGWDALRL